MKDQLTQQILNISKVVLASAGVALCVWLVAAGYPESDAKLNEIDAFVTGVYVIEKDGASMEDIAAIYADTTAEMSAKEKEDAIATKATELTQKWYDQKKAKASLKIDGYIPPEKIETGKKLKNKKDYITSDPSTVQKGDEINIGNSSSFFAIDYVIFVIGLALLGVIGFFVYQLVMRPKRTILSILGLLISALVFIVLFYSGSSDTVTTLQVKPEQVGGSTIALTTAGIYTIGICLSLGILAIVLGPVMGRYRK